MNVMVFCLQFDGVFGVVFFYCFEFGFGQLDGGVCFELVGLGDFCFEGDQVGWCNGGGYCEYFVIGCQFLCDWGVVVELVVRVIWVGLFWGLL